MKKVTLTELRALTVKDVTKIEVQQGNLTSWSNALRGAKDGDGNEGDRLAHFTEALKQVIDLSDAEDEDYIETGEQIKLLFQSAKKSYL